MDFNTRQLDPGLCEEPYYCSSAERNLSKTLNLKRKSCWGFFYQKLLVHKRTNFTLFGNNINGITVNRIEP